MDDITAALLQITVVSYYELQQIYYKLQQKLYYKLWQCAITNSGSFIRNYGKTLLQITAALLQITTMFYYKLRQLYQIITNYDSPWSYYKLWQHITTNYGGYYKLQRYYKLLRNS